ncbi:condensation domain-containing protein [Streptomyces sp. NRRL S-646]|uniref:condensation domain-containing protein n=1 Tax=Streptomyces sp. NRRL S-646 TaxID=1463917 RepID=UPI000691DBE8|nr:condensation domain-containing protein [Streptomyces sp. NRRL S-646]
MSERGCAHTPLTVVAGGAVLQLHGLLGPAAVDRALARAVVRRPDLRGWSLDGDDVPHPDQAPAPGVLHARLRRHGPAHHTLHLAAGRPEGPEAAHETAHEAAGLMADLLSVPPGPVPLEPALRAVLRTLDEAPHRAHRGLLLRLGDAVGPPVLRQALAAVLAAHPLLCTALGPGPAGTLLLGTRRQGAPLPDGLLTTARFTGRAAFDAALAGARRGLDPRTGASLRAVHAQGGVPGLAQSDLLFLAVHDLAADPASWRILLEDLDTALGALASGRSPAVQGDGGWLEQWSARLAVTSAGHGDEASGAAAPALASGTAAGSGAPCAALGAAAEGGSAEGVTAAGFGADSATAADGTAPDGDGGPQAAYARFSLGARETRLITAVLPHHHRLSAAELLAGAFGQALARWGHTHEAVFDLCTDGRTLLPAHARAVGPYTRARRIRLDADPDLAPARFLVAVASALTADEPPGTGQGPPTAERLPRIRLTPHDPAQLPAPFARFTLAGTDEDHAPRPPGGLGEYDIEVRTHVQDGRLHVRAVAGGGRAALDALCGQLRSVLEHLAGPEQPAGPDAEGAWARYPGPVLAATPRQQELLAPCLARPAAGHHIEQLQWTWHGPLDSERFTAAWQAVAGSETLLRAAFDPRDPTRITLHEHATVQVERLSHQDITWPSLLERDRRRGVDVHRPGPLRITLHEQPASQAGAAQTRVLLTFHQALVDTWSAQVLLREFYRAYLNEGSPAGGERRPDLRDYTRWLDEQDTAGARDLWAGATPPPGAAVHPARPGAPTSHTGSRRISRRLSRQDAVRLVHWAAGCGVTETAALHAAWALLLHRATATVQPATVAFGVSVDGRGICLDGAEQLTGPLLGVLPMSVDVDPAGTVPQLLTALRDRALDMSAYEWISTEDLRRWNARGNDEELFATAVLFERPVRPADDLVAELAGHGITFEPPHSTGASSTLPIALLARYDRLGNLVITAIHDRSRFAESEAAKLLAQSMRLLRVFPDLADGSRPIAAVLDALSDSEVPRMAPAAGPGDRVLATLSPGRRTGGPAVCLVPPPGADHACYGVLVPLHAGPGPLLAVATAQAEPHTVAQALLSVLGPHRPLVLAGWSGSGQPAHRIRGRPVLRLHPRPRPGPQLPRRGPPPVTGGAGEAGAGSPRRGRPVLRLHPRPRPGPQLPRRGPPPVTGGAGEACTGSLAPHPRRGPAPVTGGAGRESPARALGGSPGR